MNWSDPALYDLVINTEKLSFEAGVDLVIGSCTGPELAATEATWQAVRDRALASRVRAALAAYPETRKYRITAEAERGVIRLEGSAVRLEKAVEVARSVPGVADVKGQSWRCLRSRHLWPDGGGVKTAKALGRGPRLERVHQPEEARPALEFGARDSVVGIDVGRSTVQPFVAAQAVACSIWRVTDLASAATPFWSFDFLA